MSVRKKYREILARPGLDLVPGAGGYAAVGTLLAQPDGGQSNVRDYADHYGRICDAVNLPVFVDADTGFGGVHNVREMVRAFEKAGVAGLFIGDQVFPNRCGYMPGKEIIPVEDFMAKLLAALDARTDADMLIAARTDCFALEGIDAAIERCQLFMEAGADLAMPQGADSIENIKRVMKEVPGPRSYNMSHAAGKPKVTLKEVEELGISICSFPSASLFAAVGGIQRTMRALKRDMAFDAVEDEIVSREEYYEVIGFDAHNEREQKYVEGAQAMVTKKRQAAE